MEVCKILDARAVSREVQTDRQTAWSFLCTLPGLLKCLQKVWILESFLIVLLGCELDSTLVRRDLQIPPLPFVYF